MTIFEMYNKFFDTDMPIIFHGECFIYAFTVQYNDENESYADILALYKSDYLEYQCFHKFDTDIPRLFKVKKVYDNTHLKLLRRDL